MVYVLKVIQVVRIDVEYYLDLGLRLRKLSIYSQASVTKNFPCPTLTLPPISARLPPTSIVGSVLALSKIKETIEVVVVFPWVPEMAMLVVILVHEYAKHLGPCYGRYSFSGRFCQFRIVFSHGG